jgi:hypothetical protein
MLDFANLPKPQNGTIDYFPGFSNTNGGSWEVWNKPRNCTFIRILTISGGGGGSSGFPSATTNARGGGGSGSSSGYVYVTIPAVFLPDRLYVSSGLGGRGGQSSTTISNFGFAGIDSYVCIAPSISSIYVVCYAENGAGGQAATSSAGGLFGGFGSNTLNGNIQAFQGHYNAINGQQGITGGTATGAVGGNRSFATTGLLLSGGAGGAGGAGFVGGDITAPASQTSVYELFQTLAGGAAGTVGSPTGGNGRNGVELYQPLLATGGSGGGSSFDGTARGGDGGDGGFGCGGGGGGAGGTDGGGAGGNGGPGLVVIHTW